MLIDKKIHHFSITKTGKKRKRQYMDPLETLIIRERQSFGLHNQLNPGIGRLSVKTNKKKKKKKKRPEILRFKHINRPTFST